MTINSYVKCHPDLFISFFTALHLFDACFQNLWCVATFGLAQLYVHGKTLDEGQMKPTRRE